MHCHRNSGLSSTAPSPLTATSRSSSSNVGRRLDMLNRRMLLAAALLAASAATVAAEGSETPLGWKTPMGPKGTAYEAARRIFPGASLDQQGTLTLQQDKTLRIPGTTKRRAELPKGTTLSKPDAPLFVRSQGRRFMLLTWDGHRPEPSDDGGQGEDVTVLAVFPEGSIEPTDVAEVKQDRVAGPGGLVSLGDEDAFTLQNSHTSASQGYTLTDLFHLRDGRLRRIVTGVYMLTNTYGCDESHDENLSWRTEPDGANPPRIIATVELIHAPKEFTADCAGKPKPRTESFSNSYRWDAAKGQYRDEGGNLDRLYKWNERHL
jgi:hypothetical protein